MRGYLVAFAIGFAGGMATMWRLGHSHARALRAWHDFQANRHAMRGLFLRTIDEWKKALKAGLFVLLIVVFVAWVVIANV